MPKDYSLFAGGVMTNRIWIVLTIIVVMAGYGFHHKVQRVTAPAQQGALFK